MKALVQEKEKAILLRKKGFTYNEILTQVPVAKSSLSLWLKDMPLTKTEKSVLRKRKNGRITKGRIKAAAANRKNRSAREAQMVLEARAEFEKYKEQPLFHTGIALYWAEGAKRSNMFQFTNSDEHMINIMISWLETYVYLDKNTLRYRLYAHKPYAHEDWEQWWAQALLVEQHTFKRTVYKPSGLKVKKRPNYKGCLRVEVPRSTMLLKKMKVWINMSIEYYRKQ